MSSEPIAANFSELKMALRGAKLIRLQDWAIVAMPIGIDVSDLKRKTVLEVVHLGRVTV